MNINTISVIGLGYIGLPTAAMFASKGINVIGIDISESVVDTVNKGQIHIVEPDLDTVVHQVVSDGKLKAQTRPAPADVFIIAVPTPFKGNYEPDLSFIKSASKAIAPVLKSGDLVVLESTSPVGTTEKMAVWLAEERSDLIFPIDGAETPDIYVSHCPERVLPGNVMNELIGNDRIIGGLTAACAQKSVELYKLFVEAECIVTNARTAEMAKLTENSSRDVSIAFANELSLICDEQNIDVRELIALANRHPRVNILQPGCGVGGHCIAVDPWFIVNSSPNHTKLIKQARLVNDSKPDWVVTKTKARLFELGYKKVCCYGIAFKPNIDDIRESPALKIVVDLCGESIDVSVVEPNLTKLPEELNNRGASLLAIDDAIRQPDTLHVVLVAHSEFQASIFSDNINQKDVLDVCGALSKI